MLIDYSYCNEAFVDGLKTFLDYTAPNSFHNEIKAGLIIRKCPQKVFSKSIRFNDGLYPS